MGRFVACADCVTPLPHLFFTPLFHVLFFWQTVVIVFHRLSFLCNNGVTAETVNCRGTAVWKTKLDQHLSETLFNQIKNLIEIKNLS